MGDSQDKPTTPTQEEALSASLTALRPDDSIAAEVIGDTSDADDNAMLDEELNAKRAYNRVCTAKSRAKRKKFVFDLEQKVTDATSNYNKLKDKNKALRDEVDSLLQDAIYAYNMHSS